jgi:predicted enzyme related to lactoylglutathione lyase
MSAKKKKAAKKAAPKKAAKKPAAKKPAKKAAPRAAARKAAAPKATHPQILHWEIQSQTPAALHAFYSDVFGWVIDANNPMNYGMVTSGGGGGINGGIGGSQAPGSRVLVYAAVKEIDPILAKIEASGGKTIMPRTDIGPVIMAIYTDPEGNTMGLIEGTGNM